MARRKRKKGSRRLTSGRNLPRFLRPLVSYHVNDNDDRHHGFDVVLYAKIITPRQIFSD